MTSPVAVLTDSCASIPERLIEQLNIEIVPYYVHRGKEIIRDLVDMTREEFFGWMVTAKELPKSGTPGPGEYLEAFRRLAGRAREIVTVCMTSVGSGAYQAATVAKEMAASELPDLRIEMVDTLQVAMCHGWSAIEAARAALAGASLEKVAETAREVAGKSTMIQTADTLRYLYMGGRIGRATHMVGTLLNIKPLIGMEEGVITPLGQARSRRQAYKKMVEIMIEKAGLGARIKVGYVHALAAEEVEKLRGIVEPNFDCAESLVAELSLALGVHTGPGTVGVGFFPL
ncbi:MAG: DegV family protein [Chloroflexi bacterium]|nr:DegV family protein [Chloroflexota bacterium]